MLSNNVAFGLGNYELLLVMSCGLVFAGCTNVTSEVNEQGDALLVAESGDHPSDAEVPEASLPAEPSVQEMLELGKDYLDRSEYDLAIDQFTRVLQYEPHNEEKQSFSTIPQGISQSNKDRLDLDSLKIDAQYHRGLAFLEKGFPDTAVEDFKEVIPLRPKYAMAYLQRGRAYAGLSQWRSANRDYTKAIRLQPDNAMAYRYRGFAYRNMRKFERAIADLNEVVRRVPKHSDEVQSQIAEVYHEWSSVLADSGKIAEANEKEIKAREIRPELADLADRTEEDSSTEPVRYLVAKQAVNPVREKHYQQGLDYLEKEEFIQAIDEFNRAIAADPTYSEAYAKCGLVFLKRGFPDTAREYFLKALSKGKKTSDLYCLLAQAYENLEMPWTASRYATEAIILDSKNAEAYLVRSISYRSQGKADRADLDLKEAIRLNPVWEKELQITDSKQLR